MNEKQFIKKWFGVDPHTLSEKRLVEYKDDRFVMYEKGGFVKIYQSPDDDNDTHNGMRFKVIRRAKVGEVDLEALPIWLIEFENGETAYCYAEEICKIAKRMIHTVEVTCGSKEINGYGEVSSYDTGGSASDGCYFKDAAAFLSGKGICYIGENAYDDMMIEICDIEAVHCFGKMNTQTFRRRRREIFRDYGWTRKDFIDMCGGPGFEKVAEFIFNDLSWEEPTTLFDEFSFTPEDLKLFGLTREQVLKVWGEERLDDDTPES